MNEEVSMANITLQVIRLQECFLQYRNHKMLLVLLDIQNVLCVIKQCVCNNFNNEYDDN